MRITRILACEREKQRVYIRALKREHMRRWRAVAVNRERERAQQRVARVEKKIQLLTISRRALCGFCYQRAATIEIERLAITSRGFRRIFVPYCGVC